MTKPDGPVALYHVTPVQNIPWIMKVGLRPQLGPIAKRQGIKDLRVRLYTSAQRAREAISEDGDFRKLAVEEWGPDVKLYVYRIFMNPGEAVAFAEVGSNMSVSLICRVPESNLQLLNTELEEVPQEEIDAIVAEYGDSSCSPPATYQPLPRDLPF